MDNMPPLPKLSSVYMYMYVYTYVSLVCANIISAVVTVVVTCFMHVRSRIGES